MIYLADVVAIIHLRSSCEDKYILFFPRFILLKIAFLECLKAAFLIFFLYG